MERRPEMVAAALVRKVNSDAVAGDLFFCGGECKKQAIQKGGEAVGHKIVPRG